MGGIVTLLSDKSYKKPLTRNTFNKDPTLQSVHTRVEKKPMMVYVLGQRCFGRPVSLLCHKHYTVYPITPE